jgi:molecular chaperone HtpG
MENRDRLADLLRYESLKTERGKTISLAQYVEGMKEGQSEIYYLTGMSREQLERSPHLEAFRARDWDVLLMTDPMDEWVVAALHEYKEKHFKAVDRGALPDEQPAAEREAAQKQYEGLLALLKDKIPEVKEVRLSSRLKESAAVLVTAEGQLGPHLEMILKQLGQENVPTGERILELNPDHAAVQATRALFDKDAADSRLGDYARLLYEQALLAEGSRLPDPVGFAARVNALIAKDAGG